MFWPARHRGRGRTIRQPVASHLTAAAIRDRTPCRGDGFEGLAEVVGKWIGGRDRLSSGLGTTARVLLSSESCQTGTRAQSGSRTGMLTVACGQGRRSAASLDLDCFIAVTATRFRGDWMSVLRT